MLAHQVRVEADPRLRLDKKPVFPYKLSAESVSPYSTNADSSTTSGFTWNSLDAPTGTVLDRKMYVKASFDITLTGTSTTGQLINIGVTDAIRAYPLSQIISSTRLVFNGRPYDAELTTWGEPLLRYANNHAYAEYECSSTGSFMDQYQNYEQFISLGDARNVLGSYGSGVYRTPRGGLPIYEVLSNTATSAVVRVSFTEPLFIVPLALGENPEKGIAGVQTWSLALNFISNAAARLFSCAEVAGRTIATASLAVNQIASLQYFALTPKMGLPNESVLPYFDMVKNVSNMQSMAPGAVQQVFSGTFNLKSVPLRAYIYACKDVDLMTVHDTNSYMSLENINIGFDNTSGILANATKEQLYRISAENGCELNWSQWSKEVGSVFCLDFGKDISLREGVVAGLEGRYSFNIRATFKNNNPTKTVAIPKLYVITVHPGYIVCSLNGNIQQHDYLYLQGEVPKKGMADIDDDFTDEFDGFYGAGVKDMVKAVGKKIAKAVVPSAAKIALAIINNPSAAKFMLDAATDLVPGADAVRDLIQGIIAMVPAQYKDKAVSWLKDYLKSKGGFYGGIAIEVGQMKKNPPKRLVDL